MGGWLAGRNRRLLDQVRAHELQLVRDFERTALGELRREAGRQFDPRLVDLLAAALEEGEWMPKTSVIAEEAPAALIPPAPASSPVQTV